MLIDASRFRLANIVKQRCRSQPQVSASLRRHGNRVCQDVFVLVNGVLFQLQSGQLWKDLVGGAGLDEVPQTIGWILCKENTGKKVSGLGRFHLISVPVGSPFSASHTGVSTQFRLACAAMKALQFERKEARYVAAMVASRLTPGAGAAVGPLSLTEMEPPELPNDDWRRISPILAGICGSDLHTIAGHTSRYFEPLVSFPFVLGHEVVGLTEDGERVVLDAVLGHAARGAALPFEGAAPGDGTDYSHLIGGPIAAGLQCGSCESTGGGWSESMIAHVSQIHSVPEDLSDEAAVMVEPAASGVHAALKACAGMPDGSTVVVLGAGTIGLCSVAALSHNSSTAQIIATAKHPEQKRFASQVGADVVVEPGEIRRAVRRATHSQMIGTVLAGGADVVIDAVGTADSLADALAVVRPRGRVVLCGMPGTVKVDLAPLWHREVELVGCYTYGTEQIEDGTRAHTFDLAFDLVRSADLGRMVSATYPLADYQDAIRHAAEAGRRGAIKIAFDLR